MGYPWREQPNLKYYSFQFPILLQLKIVGDPQRQQHILLPNTATRV